ncbi:MAG: tripartite tricarboxylate transporter substrate binding protein [Synergistaceae bacterium]|nr:tripartite tricarboxylate transporter substrate binding protein [Synergistaceae bacterium]
MKKSLIAAALVLTAVFSGTVLFARTAEAAWPEKNITVIITHGAGGDTDFNARLMCRLLEQKLGVSVVPTNVTGSNGAIAMAQYKDGTPDGYTFLMTNTAALTGNEATGLSDYGYDAFEVVSVYAKQSGENIVVPADSPYKTLADLIEASKKNPNTIKFGVSTGGGVYIASVILEHAAGTKFAVIDEGDAASRMTALLGKHVDATIVPYAVVKEYIQAGQVRTLGTLLKEPPALLKDIPTAHESGCPELILNTLYACLAPRGTSPEIVRALNAAMMDISANSEEYKKEVNRYNLQEPWTLSVEDSVQELKNQRELFMKYSKFLQ